MPTRSTHRPRWHFNKLARHRRYHCQHATHDDTPPRKQTAHATQAKMSTRLARHTRHPRMERHFSSSHGIKQLKLPNFCRIREKANYIIVDKSHKNYNATSKKI